MEILILSDIHANWTALEAVLRAEPDADRILCLGDLVNYGPQPVECVAWAMNLDPRSRVLQGNHDLGFSNGSAPSSLTAYELLSEAVQTATEQLLNPEMQRFLGGLQPMQKFRWEGTNCIACHAIPSDPLYGYMGEQAAPALWESEMVLAHYPEILFLGHTHVPMVTQFQRTLVINPGSVGQPRDGDPWAAYAIWKDGSVALRRAAYDVEDTIRGYERLAVDSAIKQRLAEVLRTGGRVVTELPVVAGGAGAHGKW
jgi:predicted phosphodiesterase